MKTAEYLSFVVNEIHTTVVATVDDEGLPVTAAIDMMDCDENSLYFLTAKGKSFYDRLIKRGFLALTAMKGKDTMSSAAVSIHRKLPKVKTIAMYASIQNIKHKTDAELRRLCDLGVGGLDIGVESGLDAALTYMNKGHTAAEAKEQLLRLTKAGITYSFNAILGCGGADLWRENADATADLINAVQPHLLFIGSLHAQPGCRLYNDMKTGAFKECTIGQLLDEQEQLIFRLELNDTIYFGSHPSNIVPMQAILPKHKDEMLRIVRETRKELQGKLDEYPVRGGEGSIINR